MASLSPTNRPAAAPTDSGGPLRPGRAIAIILLASAAAHLWCLGSQFYLDDFSIIVYNDAVAEGRVWGHGTLTWTTFWYWILGRMSGGSPVAYHAMNWCLHSATALLLWAVARQWLGPARPGTALFAAVLFAVHPLGSEIPNYARTQDLAWVTVFSLAAALAARSLAQSGGWKPALVLAAAILGASFSKGPGIFHAGLAAAAAGVFSFDRTRWAFSARSWLVAAALLAVSGALVFWLTGWWWRLGWGMDRIWSVPRFAGHAYTITRVFWEFVARVFLPVGLSADHHIAETLVPTGSAWWNPADKTALAAALGLLGVIAGSLVLAIRPKTRLVGISLLVFALTMAMRVFYVLPEYMPEYRIYPGLPWICLAIAVTAAALGRRLPIRAVTGVATLLVLVCIFLSARRAHLWHDIPRLMEDVLAQYPTQSRAVWLMQAHDARLGRWDAVQARHAALFAKTDQALQAANRSLAPAREFPTGQHAFAVIGSLGIYARALAHTRHPSVGLDLMNRLEASLRNVQPPPQESHWQWFLYAKGLVQEVAGDYRGAALSLAGGGQPIGERKMDLDRVLAKLAARDTEKRRK